MTKTCTTVAAGSALAFLAWFMLGVTLWPSDPTVPTWFAWTLFGLGIACLVSIGVGLVATAIGDGRAKVDDSSQPVSTVVYNIERHGTEAEFAAAIEKAAQVRAMTHPMR
jgi:hypothetical protein